MVDFMLCEFHLSPLKKKRMSTFSCLFRLQPSALEKTCLVFMYFLPIKLYGQGENVAYQKFSCEKTGQSNRKTSTSEALDFSELP